MIWHMNEKTSTKEYVKTYYKCLNISKYECHKPKYKWDIKYIKIENHEILC